MNTTYARPHGNTGRTKSKESRALMSATKKAKSRKLVEANEKAGGKVCSKCESFHPFADYYDSKDGLNGKMSSCRFCQTARSIAYNKANRSRHVAHERSYKKNSPEKARLRDVRRLAKRRGLTLHDRKAIYVLQRGKCGICRDAIPFAGLKSHLDHCHKTQKVRGFLCASCNAALGYLRDNVTVALQAAEYLKRGGVHADLTPERLALVDVSAVKV